MKIIFSCVLALCVILPCTHAQEAPKVGFIRIVNAIAPGVSNANILIDGEDLFPNGYKLGQTTGGYGVKEGQRTVEIRKSGIHSGKINIDVVVGETLTLVAYAELLQPTNPGEQPKWKIKFSQLKQQDNEHSYVLSLVSVGMANETMVDVSFPGRGKNQTVNLTRLKRSDVDLGRVRDDVVIHVGEDAVTTVSLDSPGTYIVILFENSEGHPQAISFFDPKFAVAG